MKENQAMTCKGRRWQILLYLTHDLDPSDRDSLEAHLESGCIRCQSELSAARGLIACLSLTLPLDSPPDAPKRRLMERVRQHRDAAGSQDGTSATEGNPGQTVPMSGPTYHNS